MRTFIRIGIDLAKNFFRCMRSSAKGLRGDALSRGKVLAFFAQTAPLPRWDGGLQIVPLLGARDPDVRARSGLDPPAYTKPYVKRGKNDANDAAAICEAMSRPDMRFVPIKSADQQAVLMLHKTRELLVKQRTMTANALRGHLSEFGLISPKGIHRVMNAGACASRRNPSRRGQARTAMLASHSDGSTKRSTIWRRRSPRRAARTRRAGCWTRSRLRPADRIGDIAFNPDPSVFRSGSDFQRVSGHYSEPALKRRQGQARRHHQKGQLISAQDAGQGCTSVLRVAHKYKGALAEWIVAMRARKPGARRRRRPGQQAGQNRLGDDAQTGEAFRTELLHEGLTTKRLSKTDVSVSKRLASATT